jgi:hypothetical protein
MKPKGAVKETRPIRSIEGVRDHKRPYGLSPATMARHPRFCPMSYCKQLSTRRFILCGLHFECAGDLPKRQGDCADTAIKSIGTRLEGVPDSGGAVSFENGGDQVGYDRVPAIEQSKNGDPVRMGLVALPRNCPKGDDRAAHTAPQICARTKAGA